MKANIPCTFPLSCSRKSKGIHTRQLSTVNSIETKKPIFLKFNQTAMTNKDYSYPKFAETAYSQFPKKKEETEAYSECKSPKKILTSSNFFKNPLVEKDKKLTSLALKILKNDMTLDSNRNHDKHFFSLQNILLYNKDSKKDDFFYKNKIITNTNTFSSEKTSNNCENDFLLKSNRANVSYFRDILASASSRNTTASFLKEKKFLEQKESLPVLEYPHCLSDSNLYTDTLLSDRNDRNNKKRTKNNPIKIPHIDLSALTKLNNAHGSTIDVETERVRCLEQYYKKLEIESKSVIRKPDRKARTTDNKLTDCLKSQQITIESNLSSLNSCRKISQDNNINVNIQTKTSPITRIPVTNQEQILDKFESTQPKESIEDELEFELLRKARSGSTNLKTINRTKPNATVTKASKNFTKGFRPLHAPNLRPYSSKEITTTKSFLLELEEKDKDNQGAQKRTHRSESPLIRHIKKSNNTIKENQCDISSSFHIIPTESKRYKAGNPYNFIQRMKKMLLVNDLNSSQNSNLIITKDVQSKYNRELIYKIKLIQNFINMQSEEKFKSLKPRHRKIYAIVDGTVVFRGNIIKGAYFEIPRRRYLSLLENQKKRLECVFAFLLQCTKEFQSIKRFKNIFLINGAAIFDLIDIPETEKAVYISTSEIFRGIHLFHSDRNKIKELVKKEDYRLLDFHEFSGKNRKRKKFVILKKSSKNALRITCSKVLKPFKSIKRSNREKINSNTSFCFGYEKEIEIFQYFSDNEDNKKRAWTYLQWEHPSKYEKLVYFNKHDLTLKKLELNSIKREIIAEHHKYRDNEQTKEGLLKLIDKYNMERSKVYNFHFKQHSKNENDVETNTKNFMKALIERLQIFRNDKKGVEDLDDIVLYGDKGIHNRMDINKQLVQNIQFQSEFGVEKFYPNLISLNIPRLLKIYPKIKRRELYEIFIQYKTLIKLCICLNRSLKILKRGIDFSTFFNCIPQMKSQGEDLAKKIFETLNILNNNYLSWDEFMKGMLTMKSKEINQKIQMFFSIIDTDGNGMLSYNEVYDLSLTSLKRSGASNGDTEVVEELAEYFANMIFQLVEKEKDEEIPLERIKDKIIEGGTAADYLEMFICTDTFTSNYN